MAGSLCYQPDVPADDLFNEFVAHDTSSPLKKGTGTAWNVICATGTRIWRGASPLFQRTASAQSPKSEATAQAVEIRDDRASGRKLTKPVAPHVCRLYHLGVGDNCSEAKCSASVRVGPDLGRPGRIVSGLDRLLGCPKAPVKRYHTASLVPVER